MADEFDAFAIPITLENKNDLLRLAIAIMFDGTSCAICKHAYEGVDDFIARNPVCVAQRTETEPMKMACSDCYARRGS